MPGKPKRMSQIKQLILLHKQGLGKKAIARMLEMSKNTVKAYISKIENSELDMDQLLAMEEPLLENKLLEGNPAYKEERYEDMKHQLPYYADQLKMKGVTRRLLWEDEYRPSHPGGYGYTQFCYHINQYLSAKHPSMVLEHKAADKLYIDFAGKKLSYVDPDTGEIIPCDVFVACLPFSDYCFAIAVPSQSIEDFIFALICCLNYLGGVPLTLVPDNLKSAITRANKYEPDVNQALEDLANHYGTTVTPARVRKPKDKALVENQVRIIYTRVYARLRKQIFFDIHSLNKAIFQLIKEHNQTRKQREDYCREEKFLSDEKPKLLPLPREIYEIKYYNQLTVAKNNHIYFHKDNHYYSVPYSHMGQKVKVIYTRSMVYIYARGEQIAIHPRSYQKGKYSTLKEHLCSAHQHYLDRSPDYYLQKARERSENLYKLVDKLFQQGKYPEQLYRTCDGLLSLARKADPADFERACEIALEYENYSWRFITNLIENKMTRSRQEAPIQKTLPFHENTRGAGYYK